MNNFFKWIKAIFVAAINICLLCGAGHAFDWMRFVFTKTSRAGRRIKQFLNLM
jgi:hypothetical protein